MQVMLAEKKVKRVVNVQMPAELFNAIAESAAQTDTPKNKWILRAIKQRLEREKAKSEK